MKKILLALALIGLVRYAADAQKKSIYDKNYKVCLANGKYRTCNSEAPAAKTKRVVISDESEKVASLRRMDTYVHMGYRPSNTTSNKRNPRILLSYDDPQAPYLGEESRTNDGVQKNIQRNINYLDNSVDLPPNDGGLSDRR
jgi:hypothetical protein